MSVTTAPDAPRTDGPVVAPTVDAVLLSPTDRAALVPLLDLLALQDRVPDRVLVLDRTASLALPALLAGHELAAKSPVEVHPVDADISLRAAVSEAAGLPGGDLLWILPAGAMPEADTLARLIQAFRRSDAVGIVGPKHLRSEHGAELLGVGITSTRSGRVLATPPAGEADQGQYDQREDVLAVPLAGALIARRVLEAVRGSDPSFGDLGGSLDLGWRAQSVGHRVVLEPHARMHTREGVAVATADTSSRRRQARRVALTRAAWWTAPFLALWILATSVFGALGLLLLKRPRAAARELGDIGALEPVRLIRARYRTRTRRVVRRRHLRGLFANARDVRQLLADSVHEAVVPNRPIAERGADDLPGRSWMLRALGHPGLLAVLAGAVVSALAGRSLEGGLVTRISTGVSGGELLGGNLDAAALWHGFIDGWTGSGLGAPGSGQPHLAVLAALTWVAEHTIARDPLSSPSGAAVGALLAVAIPLATFTAYLAGRALTPLRWPRALGALAWATTGVAGTAIAQGRLGAVVALVLLPLVGAGLVRLADAEGTVTGAFATALAAALLGAFAPALLLVVLLVALVLLLVGRGGARWRGLIVLVVPVLLLGSWVRHLLAEPRLILGGPGLTAWGRPEPPAWQLALLHPGGSGSIPVWLALPLVALGVLGLLLSTGTVRRAWATRVRASGALSTGLGLLGLVGLAAVLLSPRVVLAQVPAGLPDAGDRITPWPGTFMLVLALALTASAVRLVAAVPLQGLVSRRWAWWSWPATAGLVTAALVTAVALAWFTLGTGLRTWTDPRPPVAIDQANGTLAGRMMFVETTSQGATFRVVGREAGLVARDIPTVPAAERDLAPTVAGLLDGTALNAARTLAGSAIGFVAVDRRAPGDVTRRLDAAAGLTRLAPRGPWEIWRVSPLQAASSGALAPPRLQVVTDRGAVAIDATGAHAATSTTVRAAAGSRLVVAEPADWSDVAVVRSGGRVLEPTKDPHPTYALPTGAHPLTIDLPGPDRWWHLLQGAVLLVVVFLAIPFGTHESRTRR
jgi:GT2 family glycosyltransferase